jgi:hypothetical protein
MIYLVYEIYRIKAKKLKMEKRTTHSNMRIYHRYLGYFLAGIMAVYAISGVVMIFRDTDFLKSEKHIQKALKPNLAAADVGKELKMRDLKIVSENDSLIFFKGGSYNKVTGNAAYVVKEWPAVINKLNNLHKASSKEPLFYLNVFFGISLLFFVVSAFWMFLPKTAIFKKGLYFTIAGVVLTVILLLI